MIRWFLVGLVLGLSACSAPQMQLHPFLDPEGFERPPEAKEYNLAKTHFWAVPITLSGVYKAQIKTLWQGPLKKRQEEDLAFSRVEDEDLMTLELLLEDWLLVYYIWWEDPIKTEVLDQLFCPGLNANELLFLSQGNPEEVRSLGVQILFTTLAELAVEQGLKPQYSMVYSNSLRAQQGLPPRLPLSSLLISAKVIPKGHQGFWVCRR
ncbi:MAG: hypothetical protein A2508_09870 [Candidatus Lambdaproteobacteria bacterium RIFOXYD12_FULL_49_8]|nr:MAG: hypothetical protein A2508_09870 [Candidatus Lambdaproteobacteria bacterium RIFOXYD12_FULL_49_8]